MTRVAYSGILSLLLLLFGCSGTDPVDQVKDGTLEVDKSITVGNAFEHYKYFSDVKWSSGETENGRKLVEVTGFVDFAKITAQDVDAALAAETGASVQTGPDPQTEQTIKKCRESIRGAELVTQFQINQDKSFQIHAMAFRFVPVQGAKTPDSPIDDNGISQTIQEIYQERLASFALAPLISAQ